MRHLTFGVPGNSPGIGGKVFLLVIDPGQFWSRERPGRVSRALATRISAPSTLQECGALGQPTRRRREQQ
jgi:hypothetical protein